MSHTEEQQRILRLREVYGGEERHAQTERGWQATVDWSAKGADGDPPARERRPFVRYGDEDNLIARLVEFTVGGDRFIHFEADPKADEKEAAHFLELLTGMDGLDLQLHAAEHVDELGVVGLVWFGVTRAKSESGEKYYGLEQLPAEWLEVVTVREVERRTARAVQLAAELATVEGLTGLRSLPIDDPDKLNELQPALELPDDARPMGIAFARYQFPRDDAPDGFTRWMRRDYTPSAIVDYYPLDLPVGQSAAGRSFTPKPVDPHTWGLVPIEGCRMRGGRGLLENAVESLAAAANRGASYWTEGAFASAMPTHVEVDVEETRRAALIDRDETDGVDLQGQTRGSGRTLRYRTTARGGSQAGGGRVEYLETTGTGLDAAKANVQHLRDSLYETARIARHDPDRTAGVQSGIALRLLYAPSVALAEEVQGRLGRSYQRLARKFGAILVKDGELRAVVPVTGTWPPVFPLTPQDLQSWATVLGTLKGAGVISPETATRQAAKLLGLKDPEAEIAAVAKAKEDALQFAFGDGNTPPPAPPAEEEPAKPKA